MNGSTHPSSSHLLPLSSLYHCLFVCLFPAPSQSSQHVLWWYWKRTPCHNSLTSTQHKKVRTKFYLLTVTHIRKIRVLYLGFFLFSPILRFFRQKSLQTTTTTTTTKDTTTPPHPTPTPNTTTNNHYLR